MKKGFHKFMVAIHSKHKERTINNYYQMNTSKRNISKMDGGIQWTDNVFHKLYWLPLTYYDRPNKEIVLEAIRYFMYNYKNGTGTVKEWQDVFMILLLDLKINNVYIMANEDPKKEEQKKQLQLNGSVTQSALESIATTDDNEMSNWYNWCLKNITDNKKLKENVHMLSAYFGIISLFLCKLITHNCINVKNHFKKLTNFMNWKLKICVNESRLTPAPSDELFNILELVFKRLDPFAKDIICRLAQRRLELKEYPTYKDVKIVQDISCYNAFKRNGNGLLYWYFKARKTLQISNIKLLDMLKCIGGFDNSIEVIKKALPKILKNGELGKTWKICRLLRNKAHSDWATNKPQNLLAVATFVAIACDIDNAEHPIWNSMQFKRLKEDSKNIEWGISIGKSLKQAVLFETQHTNHE